MRAGVTILLLVLLPGVAASGSVLTLVSSEPVEIAGTIDVSMPHASMYLREDGAHGVREIVGISGEATVWTWRAMRATTGQNGANVTKQVGDAVAEEFPLSNATLRFQLTGAPFDLVVRMGPGGAAGVAGDVHAAGRPRILVAGTEAAVAPSTPFQRSAETVEWSAEAGWAQVGTTGGLGSAPSFPAPASGRAHLEGPFDLQANYGVVEFSTADGRAVRAELGARSDGSTPVDNVAIVQRLIVRARVDRAELPLPSSWQLAGPSATWTLDGEARWRDATGASDRGGRAESFEHAEVQARGTMEIAPTTGATSASYQSAGDFATTIDGAPSFPGSRGIDEGPAVAVGVGALGLLSFASWRILGAYYTRLAAEDVLRHPRRRAIYDAVHARPGERLRDLQHRLDMAWGAFTFHLRVLVKADHVRIRKDGAYRTVIPITPLSEGSAPLISHPVTRAVYDLLPTDGSPVPSGEIHRSLGFSRQRVDHHVEMLRARGLVEVTSAPGVRRRVARTAAHLVR